MTHNSPRTASEKLFRQIAGALSRRWWLTLLFVIFLVLTILSFCLPIHNECTFWYSLLKTEALNRLICLLCLTSFLILSFSVCNSLTEVNSLLRNENRVTWSEIGKLIAGGVWVIGVALVFNLQSNGTIAMGFGLSGAILSWVFQDRVKGVASFISLRRHHLLNIGDWIQVPKLDVDGKVSKISLTTVTLYNWDTTTSVIPISALQDGHFINLQNMTEGKTYGSRMLKSFTLDTSVIRPLTEDEAAFLREKLEFIPKEEIKAGALNAHLFRLYLHHWFMNNPHISLQPNLIIRWMDHSGSGMTLQVYAFIMEGSLAGFEWLQSELIEHVVSSMTWFGLRLYQSPSGYDVRKGVIHIDNPDITKEAVR